MCSPMIGQQVGLQKLEGGLHQEDADQHPGHHVERAEALRPRDGIEQAHDHRGEGQAGGGRDQQGQDGQGHAPAVGGQVAEQAAPVYFFE